MGRTRNLADGATKNTAVMTKLSRPAVSQSIVSKKYGLVINMDKTKMVATEDRRFLTACGLNS